MKKCTKRAAALAVVLCLAMGLLTGCTTYTNFKNAFFETDTVAKEKTIKIGVYEPTSGSMKTEGKEEVMGIELAHDLYPTVCGRNVELIYADNKSSMHEAETVIQELIANSAPSVILGSYGETLSLIASDYVKAANIPTITISSTNPLITTNNEYYFSATYAQTRQGDALADFAYRSQGMETVATVKMKDDDTATATIKRFTNRMKTLTQNNACVVGSYELSKDSADYSEIIEKIRKSGTRAVFLAVSPKIAKEFLTQAMNKELLDVLYLGDRSWDDKNFLKFTNQHQKIEIAYPTEQAASTPGELSETFLDAFHAKYGELEPTQRTAVAFDAYVLALKAMDSAIETVYQSDAETAAKDAGSDAEARAKKEAWQEAYNSGIPNGPQIKDALSAISSFEGASGVINYNGKNEATKSVSIIHMLGSTELQVYTTEP